jgi:hypothetical protein
MILPGITGSRVGESVEVAKGVTLTPPSSYYPTVSTFFVPDDGLQEIVWQISGQGDSSAFTIAPAGSWATGYGETPTSVTITLRSPAGWTSNPYAAYPEIYFSYEDGFLNLEMHDLFTEKFSAAGQTISQVLNWTGGNADIDNLVVVSDSSNYGYIIENIVFDPEPTPE